MPVELGQNMQDDLVETDLELAHRAVLTGAAVALPHFAALADLPRELKADGSVVTAADRAVETAIREVLAAARPHDAVLGEEHGESAGPDASRRWIIDPIDGTALFVKGDDRWLILMALEEDGEVVVGVAAHPAQGSIFWAVRGAGAFEGRVVGGRVVAATPLHVAAGPDEGGTDEGGTDEGGTGEGGADEGGLVGARFAAVPETWAPHLVGPINEIAPALPWSIHPGLLVARGDLDLAIQTGGQIWDFAATSLILTEAGGSFSGLNGRTRPGPGASLYARSAALRLATLDLLGDARHAGATS
ncbi:histidinol-phosphatase [Paractinoplanes ferrugineus]|uniref:Histidinol-phosphatase n=1 Tax=Paractinoplanes ferrugineus TaxID=113564 RepID=A0A919J3W5_9ACTN|nr:inositol monophosphatase [Actinoplanes ferrugineus]GIE12912.1 histidinol-phosphatase [Actinoplanes ferrugineus]